jgi:predicted nucleic acid-binding protein
MKEYLLDTNVIIGLWKHYPEIIDELIKDKKIKILNEVAEELVVKERRQYKGQQVLSDRFCKLLLFIIEVDKNNIKEFYSMLDIKYSLLVTEDKFLLNAASCVLGNERVMHLKSLVDNNLAEIE